MSDAAGRPYKAVLFDLDGTLLDSADLIVTSFVDTCHTLLGRTLDREETCGVGVGRFAPSSTRSRRTAPTS